MKKKRGFTLIELLAVIVILAIIALIAIPIILNMIKQARKAAAIDTAYGYVKSVEYAMGLSDIKATGYEDKKIQGRRIGGAAIVISNNSSIFDYAVFLFVFISRTLRYQEYDITDEDLAKIKIKGKKPDSGTMTIEKRTVKTGNFCIDGFEVEYKNKEAKIVNSNKCKGGSSSEEEEATVEDETPCELATEKKDNKEIYYIDSVEDM